MAEAFAFFMDRLVYPVAWVLSPSLREHRRSVKVQNDHLDGVLHATPDPACDYCKAREKWRNRS